MKKTDADKKQGVIVHGGSYSQSSFAIGEYSRRAVSELNALAETSAPTASDVNLRVWKQTEILTKMGDSVIQSVIDAIEATNNDKELSLDLIADRKMRLFNRILKIQKTIAEMTNVQTFERQKEVVKLGIAAEALLAKNADADTIKSAIADSAFDLSLKKE